MSKRDEVRAQIAEILVSFKQDRNCMYPKGYAGCDGGWFCLKNCLVLLDYLNKILSLVAIVDREVRLPLPSKIGSGYFKGYFEAQEDMLREGWVREVGK